MIPFDTFRVETLRVAKLGIDVTMDHDEHDFILSIYDAHNESSSGSTGGEHEIESQLAGEFNEPIVSGFGDDHYTLYVCFYPSPSYIEQVSNTRKRCVA